MSTCISFITYHRPWGRPAALSLVNEHMVCIRRVIIEPRYRRLGLASWPMAQTMPLRGTAVLEAVSVMGRIHPFLERAEMQAFGAGSDAKTERMAAALEAVGIREHSRHDSRTVPINIERLDPSRRIFIDRRMDHFCQTFTNRRGMPDSFRRREVFLSKLSACGTSCLRQVKSP